MALESRFAPALSTVTVIAATIAAMAPTSATAGDDLALSVDAMAWLAGAWEGVGPNNYDGAEQTIAFWTAPAEGVMSWTFRYRTPENGHVHFAFHVVENTEDGVFSRGIHYGHDFKNYEDIHWTYKMTSASDTEIRFACIANCRGAKTLSFLRDGDNAFLEQYELEDETKPTAIFKYKRADRRRPSHIW